MLKRIPKLRPFSSSMSFKHVNCNRFEPNFPSTQGNSNTIPVDIALNNKYMERVNRIFRWSMYRGARTLIMR